MIRKLRNVFQGGRLLAFWLERLLEQSDAIQEADRAAIRRALAAWNLSAQDVAPILERDRHARD